jgi:hypothetical protein
LQEQEKPVSERNYEWAIPAAIRTGSVLLVLRDRGGRAVAQCGVPIDAVPAPRRPAGPPPSPADFDMPRIAQPGQPLSIRGPAAGTFADTSVRVGGAQAQLLAASPRKLVFRVPPRVIGPAQVHFRRGGVTLQTTLRIIGVRLTATSTSLLRGQEATLTATAAGLQNMTEPVILTLANDSPEVVQVQGGVTQVFEIEPRQVQAGGTFTITRGLTGVQPGAFNLRAVASLPPLSQFDVPRAIMRTLATWEAATGVGVLPDARQAMVQAVLDERRRLDEFLRQQQMRGGEPAGVLAALLSHYCFDVRDDKLLAARLVARAAAPPRFGLAFGPALQQAARLEISTGDLRRTSFAQFISRLLSRFASQPVGYLFIRSVPEQGEISIDNQRKSELTNRRFVASVGEHLVAVAAGERTCRERVRVEKFQIRTVTCQR